MSCVFGLQLFLLFDYFIVFEGFVGEFGWICGFLVDVGFINQVVECFIMYVVVQCVVVGQICFVLMLDFSQLVLFFIVVFGVVYLLLQDLLCKLFCLLYVKVVLLGFWDVVMVD